MLTNFHLEKGKDMNLSKLAMSRDQTLVIPEHLGILENIKLLLARLLSGFEAGQARMRDSACL